MNELHDLFLGLNEFEPQEYTEPTLKDYNDEFKNCITTCGSCANFVHFAGEAGYCSVAENNCICVNPCAMIDIWDNKCDKWEIDPRMMEDLMRAISGYTCPYCEQVSEMKPLVRTLPELIERSGEPYFEWDEIHECSRCSNLYILRNGT